MCGIVGFNSKKTEVLDAMLKSIHHRGPDDSGTFEDEHISLGHARLSILDLSAHGHQPMSYEHLEMVFNGEVYNFHEIRAELEADGYSFVSNSDSEVVLKSFHKWGKSAVDRFIGMFAFAIYDRDAKEMYIFRDRVGVKPLYYYHDNDVFIFASEIRAIKTYKEDLQVDKDALNEYMQFQYISSGRSIYEGCHRLAPGHYLTYSLETKQIKIDEYWSILPYFEKPKFQKSEEELVDELEALLIDSFKYRMVSDVPVGVFLSGGIDSSIVAAILQKHYGNIHTFTIGFKEAKYNEATFAKDLANHLGTVHTEEFLSAEDAGEILKDFVEIYDEPFGDSSGIPTTLVCKMAKEHDIKVVLSADGGDEVFCGYERYWYDHEKGQKIFKIPYAFRKVAAGAMQTLGVNFFAKFAKSKDFERKFNQLSTLLACKDWKSFYEQMIKSSKDYEIRALMGEPVRLKEDSFALGEKEHPMQGMMNWDYHRYMVDDVLVKVDRATMYNSIEGREPLLDHRIAEFMAQVPFELKYKDGTSKYLLKQVLYRYVPRELIDRPKMGFGIPMFEWFSEDLKTLLEKHLNKETITAQGFFNYEEIEREMGEFEKGKYVNIDKLWFILVFQMWHARYMK
jgi:asparagine synthase (glutamine-hydrolysing)